LSSSTSGDEEGEGGVFCAVAITVITSRKFRSRRIGGYGSSGRG
jgi:hypothetical protein